jgi:hypothetical protein
MRGQYLTIEYIIFFVIGVIMVISVYYIFSDINSIAEKNTVKTQLKSVGEMVRGAALKVLEVSSNTNSDINYNVSIPTRLSRCIYVIESNRGLSLNCTHDFGISSSLSLYNLNITTENTIYSTRGYVEIRAHNKTVVLK